MTRQKLFTGVLCCIQALAAFISTPSFVVAADAQVSEGAELQQDREAYWALRYGLGDKPTELADARARLAALRRTLAAQVSPSSSSWTPLGPGGFFPLGFAGLADAGRVDGISLDLANSNTLYLSSPTGGAWKSTSGGDSWLPLTDHIGPGDLGTVAVDPVNPSVVYATCYDISPSCFVMRSRDGGATWASTGLGGGSRPTGCSVDMTYGECFQQIYIDPSTAGGTSSSVLIVAGFGGVYRSIDGGATWNGVYPPAIGASIVALPSKPQVLFGGVVDGSSQSGLARSTDTGATWSVLPVPGLPQGINGMRLQLAVSPATPNSVWLLAGGGASGGFIGLWRWDDSTSQLTQLAAGGIGPEFGRQGIYDLVLAVDPASPERVYVGGTPLYRSLDSGATFSVIASNVHVDWHALLFDPRSTHRLYGGNDGGIYTSPDGGDTWVSLNNNLATTQFYPGIALHPTDPTVVLGGSQDNGPLLSNGTALWRSIDACDGGFAAINYRTPTTTWTTCQRFFRLSRHSRNASGYYVTDERSNGIPTADLRLFIPPLVMDPTTPTVLYAGTQRLWRTTDEGVTWTALTSNLSSAGAISAIAIAPSSSKVIYVGTSDGNIVVSRDGGTSFSPANSGVPQNYITKIAIDALDPNHAVATASTFGAPHAWLTTDGGASWTNITGSLPDAPLNTVVMVPGSSNQIFVGGDLGVFESLDGGHTWGSVSTGLPAAPVMDLAYNPTAQLLIGATYGRGMFQYSLANPLAVLRGDVNADGTIDAFDALLIQQALVGLPMPSGVKALPAGDANCNNALDIADALLVLRAAVGLTTIGACVGTVH